MNIKDKLQTYPTKRIQPVDGMAVTAEVWEQAHNYHRARQNLHTLYHHTPGIVTGLEVIASDPPDSTVYIMPGIAIDPNGESIVLTEPLAYDLGIAQGPLTLLLSYDESEPQSGTGREQELNLLYVHSQFGLDAIPMARDIERDLVGIELARIWRAERDSAIHNAPAPHHPRLNEIDLRYRQETGVQKPVWISVGICYLGGERDESHAYGLLNLAQASQQTGHYRVCIDDNIQLDEKLASYTLLYLVGQGSFNLDADSMNALYKYIQDGGAVLFESNRQHVSSETPAAERAFTELVESMGIQLEALPDSHPLLQTPFLFAAPPAGFETEGNPNLLLHAGIILSQHDYGSLWAGQQRGQRPTREAIRTAQEWGTNLLAHALTRHPTTE